MENELKLVKLSTKSWHYRLVKWLLGDKAPTPSNTFNFCRYFWIFMFCLLVLVPIYAPFKMIGLLLYSIGNFIVTNIEQKLIDSYSIWVDKLDKSSIWDVYYNGTGYIVPKKYLKKDIGHYKKDVIGPWAKKHLGLDWDDLSDREKIITELESINKERAELRKQQDEFRRKRREADALRDKKRAELVAKINNKLGFISDGWDTLVDGITKLFDYDYSTMIKVAKRVFGVILTLVFLVVSYFLVNILSLSFISLGGLIVSYWQYIVGGIGVLIVILIMFLLLYFIYGFLSDKIENIVKTYKSGGSVWYIQAFYLVIIKPLEYLIFKPIYWLVMIPLNFIFNHFLWKFICVKLIAKFSVWFWKGFINFTGIFGEYFAASKGDYCPGVEWGDE